MAKPQTRQQARQHARTQAKQQQAKQARGRAAQPSAPMSRQDRKDEARLQREALKKQIARRRRMRTWGLIVAALVAVGVVVAVVMISNGDETKTPTGPLPGLMTGPQPWPNNSADLDARVKAMGLPALGAESLVFHIHQHIEIFVDGQPVTVPANIGITDAGEFAVIHTHATNGVIHVESPTQRDYTLGNFFGVWGLRLTPTCIGGYCASGDKTLTVYVNGTQVQGDPSKVVLNAHDEIVVAFGTKAQLPKPIPSSYAFQNGE